MRILLFLLRFQGTDRYTGAAQMAAAADCQTDGPGEVGTHVIHGRQRYTLHACHEQRFA